MRSADRFSFKFHAEYIGKVNEFLDRIIRNPVDLTPQQIEILEEISGHLSNASKEFDELVKSE